jgi:hypothetical protein
MGTMDFASRRLLTEGTSGTRLVDSCVLPVLCIATGPETIFCAMIIASFWCQDSDPKRFPNIYVQQSGIPLRPQLEHQLRTVHVMVGTHRRDGTGEWHKAL